MNFRVPLAFKIRYKGFHGIVKTIPLNQKLIFGKDSEGNY